MPEWLYEAGIGEARAALVADGVIIEARIERPDTLRAGTVLPARLVERLSPALTRAETPRGAVMVERVPPAATLGQTLLVEIVREAIPEPGRAKRAKARPAPDGTTESDAPDLLARCQASGIPVRQLRAHEPDALEQADWSEVIEEARTGEIAFPGGVLRLSPTPAMALFDVDGTLPATALALAAATAVAQAVRRLDIGGSIGIDFPTINGKAERQAAAAAIDAALPQPFERTAINGFGFLQIVRARPRASLPEILREDPAAADALALLRQIERTPPPVPTDHRAPPAVAAWIDRHPDLVAELSRRTGVPISIRS